jgi:gliding motility-associated protein GldE
VEEGIGAGFLLLGLGICLAFSAFFSSTETAFFSLTQSVIADLKEAKDRRSRRVARLLDKPKELLITILTCNALVNVAIAVIAAYLAIQIALKAGFPTFLSLIIEILLVTGVILILGEIAPKIVALKYARAWALWTAMPIDLIRRILLPITGLLNLMSSGLSRAIGVERERFALSEDEIKTLVEVSEEHGALEQDEKEMIQGIFEISQTTVKEIMVPRVDISCLPNTATAHDVIQMVKEKGHSRLPIYNENLDNIAGLIHVKDLLSHIENGDRQIDLADILRPAAFVPEGKKIDDLLRQFQKDKSHMAIVVDEYGGTAGLVTLEDVLEEIVGEIQDEYDREVPLAQRVDDATLVADAKINISELNEYLGSESIPETEDYETLGGFIFARIGELPRPGEIVDYGNFRFKVEELSGNRIGRIRIEKRKAGFEEASE